METQKILVTGGSGFIGTNLVNELKNRGHEVYAVDLLHHDLENYRRADVRNYRQIERIFEEVVRGAGVQPTTKRPTPQSVF